MKLLIGLAIALAASAAPSLYYSKNFPGSMPAYSEITIDSSGKGQYREDPADDQPVEFQLAVDEARTMFDLAERLDRFTRPVESNLKVAKTGDKLFRWIDGATKNEQKFNYTTIPEAQALNTWFERITETERAFIELERTARFDRLGVNQALLQIQALMEKKRLVAGEQFLPLLDRVAKNASYINMARERAGSMAATIRSQATAPQAAGAQ